MNASTGPRAAEGGEGGDYGLPIGGDGTTLLQRVDCGLCRPVLPLKGTLNCSLGVPVPGPPARALTFCLYRAVGCCSDTQPLLHAPHRAGCKTGML